jgi:phage-related protein
VFYRDERGREPVKEFMRSQIPKARLLYRRSGNLLVLLHVIRKNSRAIPRRDIELAERRWLDFKEKMNNPDRRGPRPAGQDAP